MLNRALNELLKVCKVTCFSDKSELRFHTKIFPLQIHSVVQNVTFDLMAK